MVRNLHRPTGQNKPQKIRCWPKKSRILISNDLCTVLSSSLIPPPLPPSTSWFSPSAGFVKCRCLYVSVRVRAEASWLEYVTFWKKVCQMMYFWLFFFFFFTVLISSTKQTLSAVDTFISFLHLLIKGPLTHMSLVASRGSSSPPLRAQREGWPTGLSDVIGRSS